MVTFILKNADAKIETPIIASYSFSGKRLRFSTGEMIHPSDWNKETCRARKNAPGYSTLNTFLDRLEARIKETHVELKGRFNGVTPHSLREAVIRGLRGPSEGETFVQFFDRFILEKEPVTKAGTMEVYRSAVKLLKGYHGSKNFEDINAKWFEKYQSYMENAPIYGVNRKVIRKGYSANYIGKNVAILREVMTVAKKQGLHTNDAYRDSDYRKPSEEVESVYLSTDELMSLYRCELTDGYARTRDRFLIGAFTGLRFSDSSKITHQSVRDGMIFDKNKKTGDHVVIPVHWIVDEILSKYPDGLPPAISNQKTNEFLKVICKKAGIETPIERSRTIGGKVITETIPKYLLVTTHTARRSAATNMFKAGIPTLSIMKITGHRTEKSFMKYVRISQEENARLIQNHPYFSKG